eukprot:807145-Rhodomonas_salina.1
MRCAVLLWRMVLGPPRCLVLRFRIVLRACYAKTGTETAYGATRHRAAHGCAVQRGHVCPVSAYAFDLQGSVLRSYWEYPVSGTEVILY